ncbi:hypothetical protein F5Y04DRAFT_258078 [Hypomontagnella monticulosa]|nr:hypothetical protein F5Y04DRAFT_258078 [Hypomontagnella monticulosa]
MANFQNRATPGSDPTIQYVFQGDTSQYVDRTSYHGTYYPTGSHGYGYQTAQQNSIEEISEAHDYTQPSKGEGKNAVHIDTTERGSNRPSRPIGISWQDPLLAFAVFIGGMLAAVGHHLYYASLENTPVHSEDQQVWAIRIGTGLALLARCGMVATIGTVAVQQIWATLRQKPMSIGGIDSMFDVLDNPWSFLNKDLLVHAKRLTLLAAISWILPLVAIVTPATLSVSPHTTQDRIMTKVSSFNWSDTNGWPIFGGRGYYSGVGPEIARLFTTTYTSNSFVPQTPLYPNASYDLKFWGPSYKCSNLSEIVQTKNAPTWDVKSFNYTSIEAAFYGKIGPPLSPTASLNSKDRYLFKSASGDYLPNMIFIGTDGFNSLWDASQNNVRLVCQLYNTSYDINLRFENGVQSIKENSVEYLEAQDWSNLHGRDSAFLANGSCAPDPEANNAMICPTYWLTHYVFTDFLSGRIFSNSIGEVLFEKGDAMVGAGSAPIFQSGLMDCPEIWNSTDFRSIVGRTNTFQTFDRCRGGTLAAAIEDLSKNFTYSFMSYRYWQDTTTIVPVTVSTPRNYFSYDRQTLLASYLTAIAVTLFCMCVGCIALWSNGYTSSTNFSAVLLTTRNSDLDELAKNNTLGEKPLPDFVRDAKLRFGILGTREPDSHSAGFGFGFGFKGTVAPLGNTELLKFRRKSQRSGD